MNPPALQREIGPFSATTLVVANMVGTGIFMTSGFIISEVGDPAGLLLCWLVGGVFSLCGALCYAELGAAFPRAGGEYVFLRESFGPLAGFLSGWISLVVGFSAPIAAAAVAFASYFIRFLQINPGGLMEGGSLTQILALGVIVVFSLVHYHSLVFGSRVQNALTAFKIGLILIFIAAGFLFGDGSWSHFSPKGGVSVAFNGSFAVSLIFVSFAYSGWNAAAYLGGEIRQPERNIPLALLAGTLIVVVLYLLLNALYIYALPAGEMAGVMEVGAQSAEALFGEGIGRFFSGAIALGILSVISAMILAGPRIYYAMSRDKVFFRLFGQVNPGRRTPGRSISLQAAIAGFLVLTAAFDQLLIYIGFTLSLCTLATVTGLMVLRYRNPGRITAYRTPGYPFPALFFITGNLWIVWYSVQSRPVASICGLATIGCGLMFYLLFSRIGGSSVAVSTNCSIQERSNTGRLA
ncbi:MAG: amino acid permease [Desulfobacterales bacterium]|nr:amino acid permease [Desulfobacterales bacterium]